MVTRTISTYFNLILWMMLTILHSTVLGNSNETEVEPTTTQLSQVTNDYHYTTMTNDDVAIGDRIIQIWEEWKLLIVVGGSTLLFLCIFCGCIICCIKRKKKRRKKKRKPSKNVSRKPSKNGKKIKKSPKVSDGFNGTTIHPIYHQIPNSPLPDDETDIEEEKKSDTQPMIAISKQASHHDVISSDSGSSGMYEPVVDDNDTKTRGSVFDNNNNDLSDSSSNVFASDNNKNTVVNIEMVPNNDFSDTGSGVFGPGDKDQNTQKNINEDELNSNNHVTLPFNVKQPQSYVVMNNYHGEGALSDGESGAHDVDNKMNWDVPRCSLWVGSLSANHKKYAKAFKENGVDGKILNDMMVEPKLLKEIVPSGLHRKKIENEWKK